MARASCRSGARLLGVNLLFALLLAGAVRALPLIGDQTIVLLTADAALVNAGILTDASGDAELGFDLAGRLEALFPITGGDVTGILGTIEHGGSGLLLSDG